MSDAPKAGVTHSVNEHQMFRPFERAVFFAVFEDLLGHGFANVRYALEFVNRGGVDVHGF